MYSNKFVNDLQDLIKNDKKMDDFRNSRRKAICWDYNNPRRINIGILEGNMEVDSVEVEKMLQNRREIKVYYTGELENGETVYLFFNGTNHPIICEMLYREGDNLCLVYDREDNRSFAIKILVN